MITTQKAVPCVLKDVGTDSKVLCFQHPPPAPTFQIPKGTVEPGETIEEAVVRELHEESGIGDARLIQKIGISELIVHAGTFGFSETELQYWHIYHLEVDQKLPEQWLHIVTGEGSDAGLQFDYFWQPLYADRFFNFRSHYLETMKMVRNYLEVNFSIFETI